MEGRIKTALEMAMERLKGFQEVAPEEVEKLDYIPRGKALAAAFLRDKDFSIKDSLAEYDGRVRQYITEGIEQALLLNITLPLNEEIIEANKRALEGIVAIKSDQQAVIGVINEIEYFFSHYQQSLEQAREALKQDRGMRMARQIHGQHPGAGYGAERQMSQREELARMQSQLNQRYEAALAEAKDKIRGIK